MCVSIFLHENHIVLSSFPYTRVVVWVKPRQYGKRFNGSIYVLSTKADSCGASVTLLCQHRLCFKCFSLAPRSYVPCNSVHLSLSTIFTPPPLTSTWWLWFMELQCSVDVSTLSIDSELVYNIMEYGESIEVSGDIIHFVLFLREWSLFC